MSFLQVACERRNDFSVAIQNHIEDEPQTGGFRRVQHIFVYGIAIKDSGAS
jgi:hypothetical protein